ncbi:MAG: PEGA domain-containing protein [Polyangiales bacterium]
MTEPAPTPMVAPPATMTTVVARATMTTEEAPRITRIERSTMEAATTTMAARGGRGTLVVNSLPWSEVYVDGRRRGNTPIPSLQLPAGDHRIELRTADGRTHRESVTITANETSRVVHRF